MFFPNKKDDSNELVYDEESHPGLHVWLLNLF